VPKEGPEETNQQRQSGSEEPGGVGELGELGEAVFKILWRDVPGKVFREVGGGRIGSSGMLMYDEISWQRLMYSSTTINTTVASLMSDDGRKPGF
jgi:hypothetical protein